VPSGVRLCSSSPLPPSPPAEKATASKDQTGKASADNGTGNPEIKKYLDFIDRRSKEQHLGEHPYAVLNQLSEQLDSRSRDRSF